MPHCLVTGGCGFIGSHLTEALLAAGHRVRVLDALSTGKIENLAPEAELVEADVSRGGTTARAFQAVDGCFHLAAVSSVERGNRDWVGTHQTNPTGAIVVLDAAARYCQVKPPCWAGGLGVARLGHELVLSI